MVDLLLTKDSFRKGEVYASAKDERPRFIGLVISELVRDGYLRQEGVKSRPTYKWSEKRNEFDCRRWVDRRVFTATLKRTPHSERPRERLLRLGPSALKTSELLAILIRAGQRGESALQAAERIAGTYGDDLRKLSQAARGELKNISRSIGAAAFCQIMAALELGKRLHAQEQSDCRRPYRIRNSSDAVAYCRNHFERLAREAVQEEFHVVLLDSAHQVLKTARVTVGLTDKSLVHPREVFKPAIQESASALILVHNHPSGDPTPSAEDLRTTREMKSAAELLGLRILDHLILGREKIVSMVEEKSF
jgi:DNA repair protein RadC